MAAPESVMVSYLHTPYVSASFTQSLIQVYEYERVYGHNRIFRSLPVISGPLDLDYNRNQQVKVFLEKTSCDWLWIIDSDIGFKPETLEAFFRVIEAQEDPMRVLSGLYWSTFITDPDHMGGWYHDTAPVAYGWGEAEDGNEGFLQFTKLPEDTLLRVHGVGAGCLMLHRSALEDVSAEYGENWFTRSHVGPVHLGEDLAFCHRLNELDIPIYLHTGITATHHKSVWVGQPPNPLEA